MGVDPAEEYRSRLSEWSRRAEGFERSHSRITPVFINGDTAEYYFQRTIDGRLLLFSVEFVKVNGAWKIMEF